MSFGDIRSACHARDEDALIKAMVAYKAIDHDDALHAINYIKQVMGYVPMHPNGWGMMPPEHTEDWQSSPQEMLTVAMRNSIHDGAPEHIRACAVIANRYITLGDWPDMHQALVRACLPMLEELSRVYVACTPTLQTYTLDARRCLRLHRLHVEDAFHPDLPAKYRIQGASEHGSVWTRHAMVIHPNRTSSPPERYQKIGFAMIYPAFTSYEMWDDALGVKPGTCKRRILTHLGLLPEVDAPPLREVQL
jgi:hypothetical protein